MDFIEQIRGWASLSPARIAHISGEEQLTYGEWVRRADILAAYLSAALPDDHAPVAVLGHKQPEMLVAFLAAAIAGHPYIPLDTSLPPQRVQNILDISAAPLTLTPQSVRAVLEENAGSSSLPVLPRRKIAPTDPWYIIFTSGSTGEPKGVVITRACLESFVQWMLSEHAFVSQGETFLNQAPFSFDLSVMDVYLSLATGGTLYSLSKDTIEEPRLLFECLASSAVSSWVSTPSFAQMCLAEPGFSAGMLPALRRFLFCGETLTPEVAAGLLQRFPLAEVWNTYGPTEATVATTSVRIDRQILERFTPLPVGYPKADCRIAVLQPDGQPVAEGERGEIVIAGPNVSPGYLGRPELTARSFFELDGLRAYRTGDRGHFQQGLLFFDGRMDLQVKLHGYRIELGDVEENLRALPGILDVVVLPALKQGMVNHLAAFVILKDPMGKSEYETTRSLKRALGQRLPAYMVPRRFYFLEVFPLTTNGKADRRKLAGMMA